MNFERVPPINVTAPFRGSMRERVNAARWAITGGVVIYCFHLLAHQVEPTWLFFDRPHVVEAAVFAALLAYVAPRLRKRKLRQRVAYSQRIGHRE
jgi:hypothetical protein